MIDNYCLISQASKTYGPYKRESDGRSIVIIVEDDGSRRTVSYPKYLLEKKLNRPLDPNMETIDHIDRDHTNQDINNLRIVPRKEHSADDTRRVKLIDLICDMCQSPFQRSPRLLRDKSKKGVKGKFCGRQCAGKYSRQLQLGLIEPLPIQPYTESEYYRNIKNIESLANHFLIKYAEYI